MLKRLELIGFKSFADKTAFEFPAGITGVVGPNGSGKSNIVDAVRWVLGEQSAKSLRGGEMADVIFNGSTSRRSLGLAEVTMTFDNGEKSLATDAEEVQITRRVYRDGEGEYLINGQVCRLRDIKELFLGSGAGTDAYSVIQQGQVEMLLQASTQDRRAIFEEAAGISRFKVKKIETLRKLERVDLNLQRLKDIVDEVEKQLRSVKLQASKAQRYREYSDRLKELRVGLGLQEYHELTERLTAESAGLATLRAQLDEQSAQATACETEARRLEEELLQLDAAVHEQETALAAARQQIATEESTLARETDLTADLETDLAGTRRRVTELNARVAALAEAASSAAEEFRGVEAQCLEQRQGVHAREDELQHAILRLRLLQTQVQTDKNAHLEQMRRAARLQNDEVSYKAQVDNLRREHDRLRQKSAQAAEHLASLDVELQELAQADEALQARLNAVRQSLTEQRQERELAHQRHEETSQLIAELRAQRRGLASRIEVLEHLERSHEGLNTGAREVFALIEQSDPGPWRTVLGILADFLTVRHEYAYLIELALGDRAQRFLVEDADLLNQALQSRTEPFSGRVSFLPLNGWSSRQPSPQPNQPNRLIEVLSLGQLQITTAAEGTPSHPGIIATAAHLLSCDRPGLAELPGLLLGKTLIVRDLDTARTLSNQTSGFRFVTLAGELLEPDGTLIVGTHHAESGILSRKSELRELREQAAALDKHVSDTERELASLREHVAALDGQTGNLQQEIDVLVEQESDLRSRIGQRQERREGLHEEVQLSRSEISGIEQEIAALQAAFEQARCQAEEAERQVQALQLRVEQAEAEMRTREEQRQQWQQDCTAAKVALAQAEERLAALKAKHRQLDGDLQQRQLERTQSEQSLAETQKRLAESQQTMLHASATLARCYLDKEAAERLVTTLANERDQARQQKQQTSESAHAARQAWQTQQEQFHARELEANDLRHRRDTLVERLREDYQLDLAELYRLQIADCRLQIAHAKSGEDHSAEAPAGSGNLQSTISNLQSSDPNEEITELRRKLSRLGSVNLDSLQELTELETRATALQTQFDDLTAAKRSLEEIIAKINHDSRRLFMETFTAIRTHFQELFRKLFGGGMADVVLEDETDILESGIEIIARPPGKDLRSISLMSGGEKTLTAVALLLAIFRSKPSPFCILDEVDAALDEANIGRFTAVLREFLDRSQFIIVTHSKRTMSVCDVLYGITMQESGISKRVGVRFDDWPSEEAVPA